jgi:hypothetical protein|tara:strand:+ start:3785 stop:4027 length:243 start_codon:yes stop_codon:yes gene_type:complete
MSVAINSSVTKSDKVTLFTSKDDFDTWLAGLTVPAATGSTYGVVKQAAAVSDVSGSSASNNQTTINALLASLRTAGVLAT